MYLFFDKLGKLKEIINDKPLRQASSGDKIYIYFEDYLDENAWIKFQKSSGVYTNEYLIDVRETAQIPYNPKRDLKYFKDYTTYSFFVYTLKSSDLDTDGLTKATIRIVGGGTIVALGLLTFNVENSVVQEDKGISTSQYDYLIELFTKFEDNVFTEKIEGIGGSFYNGLLPYLYDNAWTLQSGKVYLWTSGNDTTYLIITDNEDGKAFIISAVGETFYVNTEMGYYNQQADIIFSGFYETLNDYLVNDSNITMSSFIAGVLYDYGAFLSIGDWIIGGQHGFYKINTDGLGNKTAVVPFYTKTETNQQIENSVTEFENGTRIVKKAEQDALGNEIADKYIASGILNYNNGTRDLGLQVFNCKDNEILYAVDSVRLPLATPTFDGLMAKEDKVAHDSMVINKENKSEKGVANGYASLDGSAKIHTSQLPDSILGQLEYKGTFNPSGGYPSSPEKGWFYISVGNATISAKDYKVGDWAVYNGASWDKVDNTDAVASVNGKLGAVILYGNEIQVGNGDTWTIEQRIVDVYASLNNVYASLNIRYMKGETYSRNEIEQRITDLLGLANLQDVLIGSYTNGQTVLASDLSDYNFVIALGKDLDNTYTGTFKPSEIVSGNVISLSSTVYLTRGATDFTITTPTSIKLWGIKLDGITADEISYDGTISGLSSTNVKTAIDELASEKADKVETRAIGEETITYTGDKVTQIESDTVLTEIFYKPNGEVDYITEFYKGDSKTYKTTLTKVEGIITKTTKELI